MWVLHLLINYNPNGLITETEIASVNLKPNRIYGEKPRGWITVAAGQSTTHHLTD